jgi:putative FmdB family regulatory protein
MPTYEYACKTCGEHVEVVQSFKDDPLKECPACGGPLRKVFGNIGIAFKGSGFYKNDSRSTAGKGAASGNGTGAKSDGGSEAGGSDSATKKSADTSGTSSTSSSAPAASGSSSSDKAAS